MCHKPLRIKKEFVNRLFGEKKKKKAKLSCIACRTSVSQQKLAVK